MERRDGVLGREGKRSKAALGDTHSAPWLPSASRRRHYRTLLLCHGNGAWRDMAARVPLSSARAEGLRVPEGWSPHPRVLPGSCPAPLSTARGCHPQGWGFPLPPKTLAAVLLHWEACHKGFGEVVCVFQGSIKPKGHLLSENSHVFYKNKKRPWESIGNVDLLSHLPRM